MVSSGDIFGRQKKFPIGNFFGFNGTLHSKFCQNFVKYLIYEENKSI